MEAGHGDLWQAAQDRHTLKAVTLLGGRQDPGDQSRCGEKWLEWRGARQLRVVVRVVEAKDGDSQHFI